jgi:Txe/YoeB family toxin of toxin-antitoxin system
VTPRARASANRRSFETTSRGLRSRRIDDEHRMVYAVEPDEITIISCRYHYE